MKILKIASLFLLATLINACSNDSANPLNQENELDAFTVKRIVNTAELSGFADEILTDIFDSDVSGKSSKDNDCFTSETVGTVTTLTFTNCAVGESEPVNGTISVSYFLDDNQAGLRIVYSDLMIGTAQISGTREMLFGQSNESGQTSILVENDIQLAFEDGTIVLEEGSKVIWYTLNADQERKIAIEGNWNVTINGKTFAVLIEENLETVLPCQYISKGLMVISDNDANASLNFGDGTCDDSALFSYPDGTTEEITLRD